MSATEWTALVVAAIGAIGAVVLQALQMYFSYKRDTSIKKDMGTAAIKVEEVKEKIDHNTVITREGTAVAATNAAVAAVSAAESKAATHEMSKSLEKKLNGGIDAAVAQAVDPMKKILDEHTSKIEELNQYVHKKNHDLLDAMQVQSTKLDSLILLLKEQKGSS